MTEILSRLAAQAEEWARAVPRPTQRRSRTEKTWFYRAYRGGEPHALIDWKQSGRADALFVREHEPLFLRPLFLWTLREEENDVPLVLLFALARLLIRDERRVGWLCGAGETTSLAARLEEQCAQDEEENPFLAEARLPCPDATLILAAPFAREEDVWAARIKLFAAQGGKGILVDTGTQTAAHDGILCARARRLEWPVFPISDGPQTLLPVLHAGALESTL